MEKEKNIKINVKSKYHPERSNPHRNEYFFSYHITIINIGEKTTQLISRYWHITDGKGRIEEVRGPGVVGEQPRLKKGEQFGYTSFCPLPTPFGVMKGAFTMVDDKGSSFDVPISPFQLATPEILN
ncbi:MAG: Co2+/Mg2+ efflux protein ApaG [Candidatus Marinimicrobia bacterium]|nr:Co2+/Mg2+ efflux protein ApaG [Candidatus Neomarinimicrobiota bacterium]